MTTDKIEEINVARLAMWEEKLTAEHATPLLLIGMGHDHNSGDISVHVPEDVTDVQIQTILRGILAKNYERN